MSQRQGTGRFTPPRAAMAYTRRDPREQGMGQLAREGSNCVSFNIRKAARTVTQLYDERLRPIGIRSTQLSILGKTMALQPLTVTQLAKATLTDRTTLTRNLHLLETQGLIQLERGEDR